MGDGSASFDFVHVADVAGANVAAMASDVYGEELQRRRRQRGVSVREIVDKLLAADRLRPRAGRPRGRRVVPMTRRVGSSERRCASSAGSPSSISSAASPTSSPRRHEDSPHRRVRLCRRLPRPRASSRRATRSSALVRDSSEYEPPDGVSGSSRPRRPLDPPAAGGGRGRCTSPRRTSASRTGARDARPRQRRERRRAARPRAREWRARASSTPRRPRSTASATAVRARTTPPAGSDFYAATKIGTPRRLVGAYGDC